MTLYFIMLATVVSTLLGGLVAFRYKKFAHIFTGLTAGTLLAVIFLEILPEIIEMQEGSSMPLLFVLFGFILFHVVEKIFSLHHSHEDGHHGHHHVASKKVGAIALIIHSFFDGLSIAVAYKVSPEFGFLLALAVIAHDFSDGFNTVSLTDRSSKSKFYLAIDAIAPVLGVLIGTLIFIPDAFLAPILGICAGILLYVCTGDVLPEAHCDKPRHTVEHLFALCAGVAYIVLIITLLPVL
ncbi:MAG: ZIP family metal transporter [Patescibacteria group bacterium]